MSKIKTLAENPKQRNIILFGLGLGSLIALAGFYMATKQNSNTQVGSRASVATTPNIQASTGSSESALYNEKIDRSNKMEAEKALQQDKTFIATPTNKDAFKNESPIDDLDKQIKAQREQEKEKEIKEKQEEEARQKQVAEVKAPEVIPEVSPPIVPVVAQPVPVAAPQPIKVAVQQKKYGTPEDYQVLSTIVNSWKAKESTSESDFARKFANNGASGGFVQNNDTAPIKEETQKPQVLSKAGTIFNAILETGINSDEPSPVLAKIVSGELKGARIIGSMTTVGEKVVVEFKTLNSPKFNSSMKISAVAVDPNTSRTSLATGVDNHYFLRYGVLLGSAFLGGYADALKQREQICTTNTFGTVTCQTAGGPVTSRELNQQALGSVGKELANQTRSQVQNIKPTVTVNSGIAIGVLLMEDLSANTK